jgi:PAS domain S-box-containing protein
MTDPKKIEIPPSASETLGGAQLRLIAEQIPAAIWTTDLNLMITSSLGSGLSGLGLRKNQLVGVSPYEYLKSRDPEFLPVAAHLQALEGKSSTYELEWEKRWFQTHIEPLRDSEGRILGVIGIALDATERKRAEEALFERTKAPRFLRKCKGSQNGDARRALRPRIARGSRR